MRLLDVDWVQKENHLDISGGFLFYDFYKVLYGKIFIFLERRNEMIGLAGVLLIAAGVYLIAKWIKE